MARITGSFLCDRCKVYKPGLLDLDDHGQLIGTGGVYVGWPDFMSGSENLICDDCMFADPRYIVRYGDHRKQTDGGQQ
jgi:hypothetical protein